MRELLLIDDNTTLLKVMGRSLAAHFKVTSYAHPKDALNYIQANAGSLDVIVTDFKMPGMTGLMLLEQAAKIKPSTVRVLLTGYAEDEIFEHTSGLCDIVIDKNICKNMDDIVVIINNLTAKKGVAT